MSEFTLIEQVTTNKSIVRKSNGKYLLFDQTFSKCPYSQEFDYMRIREDGRIDIKNDDSWGIMDKQGRIIIYPRFSKPLDFHNDLCIVQDSNYDTGYLGVVESNGFELVPSIYDKIYFEEEIFNDLGIWCDEKVVFIFGCFKYDEDYIPYIGCNGGYITHLREDYCIDLYLRNGQIISGKYECYYVTFDKQYIFAGYHGYKIIGYDGDNKEYLKRYEGYHDLINKEGEVLLSKIRDFVYHPTIKAVKLGCKDTKWAFLNSDNNFVTQKGSIVTREKLDFNHELHNIYWNMTSDDEINTNFKILAQIFDLKEIEYMINEIKKKTIWMTEEDYEDEPYPEDNYDPYRYTDFFSKDDYGMMDALDGEPDAYWNID